jgi:hypothetical protein
MDEGISVTNTNFKNSPNRALGTLPAIAKKITDRTRTEINSIYKTIYGGITQPDENDTERCRK